VGSFEGVAKTSPQTFLIVGLVEKEYLEASCREAEEKIPHAKRGRLPWRGVCWSSVCWSSVGRMEQVRSGWRSSKWAITRGRGVVEMARGERLARIIDLPQASNLRGPSSTGRSSSFGTIVVPRVNELHTSLTALF
jgi:hypothetical protein